MDIFYISYDYSLFCRKIKIEKLYEELNNKFFDINKEKRFDINQISFLYIKQNYPCFIILLLISNKSSSVVSRFKRDNKSSFLNVLPNKS